MKRGRFNAFRHLSVSICAPSVANNPVFSPSPASTSFASPWRSWRLGVLAFIIERAATSRRVRSPAPPSAKPQAAAKVDRRPSRDLPHASATRSRDPQPAGECFAEDGALFAGGELPAVADQLHRVRRGFPAGAEPLDRGGPHVVGHVAVSIS